MKLNEVMTRGVECTKPDASVQDVARRMQDLDVGTMPVCENDRLVGILTDRDIAIRSVALGHDPKSHRVRDVMTPKVQYCYDDQDVSDAVRIMEENQIRRLVVLNRDQRLAGIVSLGDLAVRGGKDARSGEALEAISEPSRPKAPAQN